MNKSLSYQTFLLAAAKSMDTLSLTLLGMILSRVLSMEDYGTYRQVWLLYYTVIPLFTLGISTSINYFIPQMEPEKQKTFVFQTFTGLFIMGFLCAIFLYFSSDYFSIRFNNPVLAQLLKIFALVPLLTMPTSYYHNLYICLKKAAFAAGILSLTTVLRFLVIAITVLMDPSLVTIFKGLLCYYIAEFMVLTSFLFRPFKKMPLNLEHQNILEQLKFTVPIGMATLVGSFSRQIDKLMISGYFTAREFAVYTNGATELPVARILNSAVMSVLMPELVNLYRLGEKEKLLELWHRSIRKVSLVILPMMVFLYIFAGEFLLFLYSEKYLESTGIFQVFLLTLPPRVTTFGSVLLAAGLSKVIMVYSVYTVIISVLLNLLLIKLWGAWGAAAATVLAIYFMVFVQLRKICNVVGCNFKQVYPWRVSLHILSVSAAAALLPALLRTFFANWLLSLFINGIIFVLAYFVLAAVTKLLSTEEIKQIKEKVGLVLNCWRRLK